MRRLWMALAVILLIAPRGYSSELEISFDQVLQGVDRYYAGLSTLKARFTQVVEVPALEKVEKFEGRLWFLKPEYLRLEYAKPKGQLMVADGQYYWFVMPQADILQAMRAPMDEDPATGPRYILGGGMREHYRGTLVGAEPRRGRRSYVLDLEPKSASTFYRSLRAWVDAASFATLAVRYIDESGNLNTFDLYELQENAAIDGAKFIFNPPPGTQILDAE